MALQNLLIAEGRALDAGMKSYLQPRPPRRLFVMVAPQVFDPDGRMLAYVNANYAKAEREAIRAKDRPTFNLELMQQGHASRLLHAFEFRWIIDTITGRRDGLWFFQEDVGNAYDMASS